MGIYLNSGNDGFEIARNSKIYVDKSELISYTNEVLKTEDRFICVSRPRRFGKSMTAQMLSAYYDKTCDSRELFSDLKIAKEESFFKYMNQYDVIFLDMQLILGRAKTTENFLHYLEEKVLDELKEEYALYLSSKEESLSAALSIIYSKRKGHKKGFIFIVDEWDCIFREDKENTKLQKEYLNFLKTLWKGQKCIDLVYMTGILPIKKYGTHSALNMFDEFSMTESKELAEYVGFTEKEVRQLCIKYKRDFEEIERWYDGYLLDKELHIYNPKSVVESMKRDSIFRSYWTGTETYEALRMYIAMNFDGLKDAIVQMLGGEAYKINIVKFQNDMSSFRTKDDVLTLLVHLGYLAYKQITQEVFIPNEEIRLEFINAVEDGGWDKLIKIYEESEKLLENTLAMNENAVAQAIENAHILWRDFISWN